MLFIFRGFARTFFFFWELGINLAEFSSIIQADWEASPRWAGASGLFCQWTAIWRVAARLRTHHLRARPRGLFRCGSIILSSQTADKSRRLGRLSHRQSAPRMWSSTLQRSVRLGCRTALSKLRGMTSRPCQAGPLWHGAHPPGIVHVGDCATAISINQNSSALGIRRANYGMTNAQLEVRE